MFTYFVVALRWLLALEHEVVADITSEFNTLVRRLEAAGARAEASVKKIEADVQALLHKQVNAQVEAQRASAIANNVRAVFTAPLSQVSAAGTQPVIPPNA